MNSTDDKCPYEKEISDLRYRKKLARDLLDEVQCADQAEACRRVIKNASKQLRRAKERRRNVRRIMSSQAKSVTEAVR